MMGRSPGLQDATLPEDRWPKVAIIILNWNGWRDTIECLESVEELTYPNYEVIVVDNGSLDDSAERIRGWALSRPGLLGGGPQVTQHSMHLPAGPARVMLRGPRFALLCSEDNLGFSGGNNLAIDYLLSETEPPEFVFLLNNDARIHPDCLTRCVGAALVNGAPIVGAMVWDEEGREPLFAGSRFPLELFWAAPYKSPPSGDESWLADGAQGVAMLVSVILLKTRLGALGYCFHPGFFMYCEESELCLWTRRYLGWKTLIVKDAVVYHKGAGSSGGPGNPLAYYYLTRNRVHLARNFLPWMLRLVFHAWYPASRVVRAAQLVVRGNWRSACAMLEGLRDGYMGRWGKWHDHPYSRGGHDG